MDETNSFTTAYQVPTYTLEPNDVWFHFLHGNVPGHQIDFMYRPLVPQPPFTRQHFSHLSRVVKYIEPRPATAYSFAITNLSRDDNQHEPGHGGIAFVLGLRINGVRDHAGRQDPPFCHAAALIDRHLDANTLYHIAVQFHKKLLPIDGTEVEGSGWYRGQYVPHAETPSRLDIVLRTYLNDFEDLYVPPPSRQTLRWSVDGATVPRRVTIVYPDRVDFPTLAACMARLAEVLIESNVKWTAVSNGREQDVPGGLTVRFVPRREATDASADEALMYLEHVPENPAEIAAQLFNAHEAAQDVRMSRLPPPPVPLAGRANGSSDTSNMNGSAHAGASARSIVEEYARPWARPEPEPEAEQPVISTHGMGIVSVVEKKDASGSLESSTDWATEYKKTERKQRKQTATALVATAVFILVFGGLAVLWFSSTPTPHEETTDSSALAPKRSAIAAPLPAPTPPVTAAPSASATSTGLMRIPSETAVVPTTKVQAKPAATSKKKKNDPFTKF